MADLSWDGRSNGVAVGKLLQGAWFKPLKNAGVLLLGRAANGVFAIAYLALTAHALGPTSFGLLVLLHGYVLSISQLAKFQSSQTLLQYGAPALANGDVGKLHRLMKFSFLTDVLGGVIGLIAIFCLTEPFIRWIGIPAESAELVQLFGFSVLFLVFRGTPTGILHVLGRFDLMAMQSAVVGLVRLGGTVVAYVIHGDLAAFLAAWFAATVVAWLIQIGAAVVELKRNGLLDRITLSTAGVLQPEPGIWRFALGANLNASIAAVQSHLGVIVVGLLLGPAAAGLYKVAFEIADAVAKLAKKFLVPALHSEILHHRRERNSAALRQIVSGSTLFAGGVAICIFAALVIAGKPIIALAAGAPFIDAYVPMILLGLAGVIGTVSVPLEPLLISGGQMQHVVSSRLIAVTVFFIVLYFAAQEFGLAGAAAASIVHAAMAVALMLSGRRADAADIDTHNAMSFLSVFSVVRLRSFAR
jgi:O-antigen/teichoic acid export membrane protein